MKKYLIFIGIVIFIVSLILFLPKAETMTEYIKRVYKLELPESEINEMVVEEYSFQSSLIFQIASFNNSLDNQDLKDLEKITKETVMDIRLDYVRMYDLYFKKEQKLIDKYFDRHQKIVENNYWCMKKKNNRLIFILYDTQEYKIYYFKAG